MFAIRKRLSATEGQPTDTRYNADCDCAETSTDGGTTWTQNDGADPRINPAYLRPPLSGAAACQAADGMVVKMQEYVTGATIITGLPALATFILGGMVFLIPLSWLFALALALAGTILTIGASAIATAFTEGVWDEIRCIIFCNVGSDGQVSTAQLDAIYDQISADIGDGTVTTIVGQIFQAWGYVGMSNAGTYGDPEADCSECGCLWRACFPVDVDASGWTIIGSSGEYASGFHVTTVFVGGDPARPRRQVYIKFLSAAFELRHVRFDFEGTFGTTAAGFVRAGAWVQNFVTALSFTFDVPTSPFEWDGAQAGVTEIDLALGTGASDNSGTNLGDATIVFIEITGIGDIPTEYEPFLC